MSQVTSKDGTSIVYDQLGQGPAMVIVGGILGDRSQQAPLAALLAEHFTVYNYDRRAHGKSGNTEPYAPEREYEDLAAMIEAAGGSAYVYGTSGCAILCLYAAAWGLAPNIKKLALWEPPFILEDSGRQPPQRYKEQLTDLLTQGRRGDMVELFLTAAVGMPAELVAPMRQAPFWAAQEAHAHTLIYDSLLVGDYSLPKERVAKVAVPTLVIDGETIPWMSHAAQVLANIMPNAQRHTIAGQPHNVEASVMVPVLVNFFKS